MNPRGAPSGPFPDAVRRVGYDAGAILTLNALPAGHARGLYNIPLSILVRAFGVGNLNVLLAWDAPLFGAVSLNIGTAALASTRLFNTSSRCIESSGLAPISLVLTPSAVSVAPVIDVAFAAQFAGAGV